MAMLLSATRNKPKPAQFGTVPGTNVGLLTDARKMPAYSWSMRAIDSCPFAFFGEHAICGESKEKADCYATQGHYRRSNVVNAQNNRFWWAKTWVKDKRTDEVVDTLYSAIARAVDVWPEPYFRVHDAGDMFNERYTDCWTEIAFKLGYVHFWVPTRSWRASWSQALCRLNTLSNVAVRPSALHFEEEPPSLLGLAAGTGASEFNWNCPSSLQDGFCGECRTCWDEPETVVMYRSHGDRFRHGKEAA